MAREDSSFHSTVVTTLCTVILAVGTSAALADDSTGRRPNAYETFYQYVALELGEAGLCEKISRSAILPGGFFIAASYAQSVCFDKVARKLGQVALCARVDRLGAMTWLDDQASCAARQGRGKSWMPARSHFSDWRSSSRALSRLAHQSSGTYNNRRFAALLTATYDCRN